MTSKAMYRVQFLGYSAKVLANIKGVEVDYATLDFVSGCTGIHADGGWVTAPSRIELGPFVDSLPKIVGELGELLKELASSSSREARRGPYSATKPAAGGMILITVEVGHDAEHVGVAAPSRWVVALGLCATGLIGNLGPLLVSPGIKICISSGIDFRRFIRKVVKRFAEVKKLLEQAEKIGTSINRRPYQEYIDEIAETGVCRVESHGFAVLIDGTLRFHPDRRTFLMRPQDDGRTFEIQQQPLLH
jgi:hypothetical protein